MGIRLLNGFLFKIAKALIAAIPHFHNCHFAFVAAFVKYKKVVLTVYISFDGSIYPLIIFIRGFFSHAGTKATIDLNQPAPSMDKIVFIFE